MDVNKCLSVYFSPYGGTQENAELITAEITKSIAESAAQLSMKSATCEGFIVETLDLLQSPLTEEKTAESGCLLLVCVPVYAGRIAAPAANMLKKLKGQGNPAIAVVVYGNRDYEDALIELSDILRENDFQVIGAAALLAPHSVFPEVAAGRPDTSDREQTAGFVMRCMDYLRAYGAEEQETLTSRQTGDGSIKVKGNRPYREPATVPVKPHVSRACNNCGLCAKLCPVSAIDKSNCRRYNKELCISCASCIKNCKRQARAFCGPIYAVASAGFKKKCAERREPEFFYITEE